jgi:hypothetical protein
MLVMPNIIVSLEFVKYQLSMSNSNYTCVYAPWNPKKANKSDGGGCDL